MIARSRRTLSQILRTTSLAVGTAACLSSPVQARSITLESAGSWSEPHDAVATYGNHIYTLSGDPSTLTIYDASNPEAVVVAATIPLTMRWDAIAISRNGGDARAYLVGSSPTMELDLGDPESFVVVRQWSGIVNADAVAAAPYLVEADGTSIRVYSPDSDPAESWIYTEECDEDSGEFCWFEDWVVAGDRAICFQTMSYVKSVACWGAWIFDLAAPEQPFIGVLGLGCSGGEASRATGVYASEAELYAMEASTTGWFVYDTTDPEDIHFVASQFGFQPNEQVEFLGDLVFYSRSATLHIVDQSDRAQPVSAASLSLTALSHFDLRGHRVYAHRPNGSIEILHWSESVPVLVQAFDAWFAEGSVRLQWSLAADEPISEIDVLRSQDGGPFAAIPIAPERASFADASVRPGSRYDYALRIATGSGAVVTSPTKSVAIPLPAASLSPAYPNPFGASTSFDLELETSEPASIRVYDALGRRVRHLQSRSRAAARATVNWDGRDDAGRLLPAGAYFVKLIGANRTLTRRVVLLR